jgi:alpha-beta hydrolase superfamily lysophospholipase
MGGSFVLDYAIRKNPRIKGAIITSPWLRLSFEPSKTKLFLVSIMKYILPGLTQPSGLIADHLSHDATVVAAYKSDQLVHGKISVSLFHAVVSAAKYSLEHASELKTPTLLLHGSDDLITSQEASREFASKTDKAELKIWEGGYHELHNEQFKDEIFTFIMKWINSRL